MMTLYSGITDPFSHRCRIVLYEKGMDFEIIDVDLMHKLEDLAVINPYNRTPVLVERDLVLYESNIINEYIDERFPHPQLMPADPVQARGGRLQEFRQVDAVGKILEPAHAGFLVAGRAERPAAVGRPVGGLHVLDEVGAAVLHVRPQDAEGLDLVGVLMAAVVDDEVERSCAERDLGKARGIHLRALVYLHAPPGERSLVVQIDAGDAALREVAGPHAQ